MSDQMHELLRAAIEKPEKAYLWTPSDTIEFTPRVLSKVYGDGRALFALTTINNRPAYWVIRGDSGWDCQDIDAPDNAPDFGDFTDEILTDLEEEFGNARCGYSGANLCLMSDERGCDCEECSDPEIAEWPMVDSSGGCIWDRMNWPPMEGVRFEKHPFSYRGNLVVFP